MDDLLFYDARAGEVEVWVSDGSGGITRLGTTAGWRTTWDRIVRATLGIWPGGQLVLLYDAGAGETEFWFSDQRGGFRQLGGVTGGLRNSWSTIVPGRFGGPGPADFLFYDPGAGVGQFYGGDGAGGLVPLGTTTGGWRTTWTHIVPGSFGGSGGTDLLFYDAGAGEGEFYATDGSGGLTQLGGTTTGWRKTWTSIVPGEFGGSGAMDLMFYDAAAGEGEFWTSEGNGNITRLGGPTTGWRKTWSRILPGDFDGSGTTDLLFYDASAGEGEFWTSDGSGGLTQLGSTNTGWRTVWNQIVAGDFGPRR